MEYVLQTQSKTDIKLGKAQSLNMENQSVNLKFVSPVTETLNQAAREMRKGDTDFKNKSIKFDDSDKKQKVSEKKEKKRAWNKVSGGVKKSKIGNNSDNKTNQRRQNPVSVIGHSMTLEVNRTYP